ncbi:MAG: FAD-dependent oxidoreductase [bacterium]
MRERIGVYICHCGTNIAGKVRVEEVRDYVATLKDVVVARDYLFMCSDPGQEIIEKDIPEHGLTRVVVASCSPRMHEITFRGAVKRGGLNPFRSFQMICIREHCSWVTQDADEATQKAKELIRGAVNRVRFHRPLQTVEYPVNPNVLIVGGGIAGMQAALDVAKAGYKAYLVERQPTIGGHMLQFDKTFPTLDCASCIGTPKMVSVGQNPNIELFTYSEVENVSGFIGNYKVTVRKKARYVRQECTGCGDCANVCPVQKPNEWDENLASRKAIYRSFPQAVPITFVIDKKDRGPCVQKCPAGTNVQGYLALIGQGKFQEALKLIMERLPLPGTLGRICPAPCEKVCRRGELDEPLAIRELKRYAADQVDWDKLPTALLPQKKHRVAIVGSGPGGLSAAYFLAQWGYQVTVFEALPVAGGMLRVGIPDYRLPPQVLDREIEYLKRFNVEIRLNSPIGPGHTVEDLLREGYGAVYLATGAHRNVELGIPGQDVLGVIPATQFLKEINLGGRPEISPRVAVIGGGNVAIDAARSALRLGATHVAILYRRSRAEMPAYPEEVDAALEEGVKIEFLVAPMEVLTRGDRAVGLRCIRMQLGEPDSKGRRRPLPVPGSEFQMEFETIISAIGQVPDLGFLEGTQGISVSPSGTIVVDPVTFETTCQGVFAGGDLVSGPATAVEAVASGREAAISIHRYLSGLDMREGREQRPSGQNWAELPQGLEQKPRAKPFSIPPEDRKGFSEVCKGLSDEAAIQEAHRCVACGACSECMACVSVCKAKAIDHEMKDELVDLEVGSIIVATGYDLMDPTPMKQFGYGTYPNVLTSLEFERLNNATGPTGGKILMRDQGGSFTKPPESVAILHCIGSRDINYHEYCSRVCCMYALKFAHLIKDKVGHDAQVYNFYIDMRCFGKGYEEFLKRVQEEGVTMIRGKAARVTDQALDESEKGKLVVVAEDTLAGKLMRVPVDMVILCAAMERRKDAEQVARIFGISTGRDGFFLEEHPKLEPVSTATSGVFVAGACQGPKDIPDTVAQAKGAASEALALSAFGRVTVSPMISEIDPYVCVGCQVCRELCPYSAIEFDERRGVSVVNEAVCKGCGSCAAYCPSGAAKVKHFSDKQIFAEIDGLLDAIRFGEVA